MTTLVETLRPAWNLGGLGVAELSRRVFSEIQKDNCLGLAAQLAYYFLFALFPFFLFLTALIGFLPVPNLLQQIMHLLGTVVPQDVLGLIQDNVRQLVTDQRGGLLSFGILAALWTSSSAITALVDALNRAYDVQESRPFWQVRGTAIGLTVGLSGFMILALILLMFGPQMGSWIAGQIGMGSLFEIIWNIVRWPVIVFFLVVAIGLVYYFAPDVEQDWKWLTPGSVFAVLLWILISLGFSFYVNNFGAYNKTYGTIGVVIVLLTWMYISGLVLLVGGEINSEIEHAAAEGKDPAEKTFQGKAAPVTRVTLEP